MKLFSVIFIIAFGLIACKKDEPKSIYYGYEFFPVHEGHFRVYDVVDIFHDVALDPQHDTSRYQIKEVIAENLVDGEGDTIQKIRRYWRESDTLAWEIKDIWTQKRTKTTGEVLEENKRMIKLIFAIAYERSWDGNALNNLDRLEYYYDEIYEPYQLDAVEFDSTVIVEKENFSSFIDYRRQYDVYAKNIGIIKSVYKVLEIDNADTLDIQKGPEITYTLVDYGVE
ncbi:hypothetical protein [Crocinitomix algicola]|uniref:hypothetical protein n=1 Tax=Crocinitomix algicola TaxID=1740263 RepID=UPI000872309C|nr:hypothetical protein [Crocinitomix algicola]